MKLGLLAAIVVVAGANRHQNATKVSAVVGVGGFPERFKDTVTEVGNQDSWRQTGGGKMEGQNHMLSCTLFFFLSLFCHLLLTANQLLLLLAAAAALLFVTAE